MSGPVTVVKVGGALAQDDAALVALCRALADAGERDPLLVVPGGGRFADAVREHDARLGLRPQTAHRMAVLAMDQFGHVLGDLIPRADVSPGAAPIAPGRVRVLLPASLVLRCDPLPNTWDVTSDSIAAWVAGRVRARRLVLLKRVDGIYADAAPLPRLGVGELEALQAVGQGREVDPHLPAALPAGIEAWVIKGVPERVLELLDSGRTRGTLITRAPRGAVARR